MEVIVDDIAQVIIMMPSHPTLVDEIKRNVMRVQSPCGICDNPVSLADHLLVRKEVRLSKNIGS